MTANIFPPQSQVQSKVIIASPNANVRSHIHKILISMNWPAEEALGGADALNKLEGKPQIEAVLLDHWLPDLDVDDLDHSLRAQFPAMDVVLVDLDAPEPSHSNRAAVPSRTQELFWALRKGIQAPHADVPETSDTPLSSAECLPAVLNEPFCEPLPGMIGSSKPMLEVARLVRLVAGRKIKRPNHR
ncbi:MAG: putative two component, sigma54 specific, transcriptional regulator, Fis family [Acidobacteriales bacterium]|nr:putative two component, sigma54 specific, transcriptional regulator, Fis family [Terriglobales bacterium]